MMCRNVSRFLRTEWTTTKIWPRCMSVMMCHQISTAGYSPSMTMLPSVSHSLRFIFAFLPSTNHNSELRWHLYSSHQSLQLRIDYHARQASENTHCLFSLELLAAQLQYLGPLVAASAKVLGLSKIKACSSLGIYSNVKLQTCNLR